MKKIFIFNLLISFLLLAGCGGESRKSAEAPNPALQNEARIVESPSESSRPEREPQREAPTISRATNPRW